jgi:branched-chain amino acid transport system ATP-binding protein
LDGVSKYFGGLAAVRGVNLSVADGEIVGLIGPNGSGKTTLFNLITGVFRPSVGHIRFGGRDVVGLPPAQLCKLGVARTFQLVRPFMNLTVLDNVAIGRIYGREPARDRKTAESEGRELLRQVGLADRAEAAAHSLTLVGRKRLELARALATRPRLLLLDELLAGLNPSELNDALDLISRLRTTGITVMLVEHLVKAVFGVADRIVVLNAGEKIADDAPAAVASDQRVIDAYLGTGVHA